MTRTPAFVLMALVGIIGHASDTPADRATLNGLKAIKVAVDPPGTELEGQGLSAADLQSHIEERLRSSGITLAPDAKEFLGLHVIALQEVKGPYGISLSLGLYQPVFLERSQTVKSVVPTWETQGVLVVRMKQLQKGMYGTLDQLVDQFAKAFASANPN